MQPGVAKLPHLFQPGRFGRFEVKNRIKYGACCVSNYNTRDGFITEREIARMRVLARTGCGIITNPRAYPDPLGEVAQDLGIVAGFILGALSLASLTLSRRSP